jgi:hypothetical protein
LLHRNSRKWRSRNHDPRMNRTDPKYHELLGVRWYSKYLVCSWYWLQLSCVFLECVLLPCACACFWPPDRKNPLTWKSSNRKSLWSVFPSHLFMAARVA